MPKHRSLVDLDDLQHDELEHILSRARRFGGDAQQRTLAGVACVNMFFEPSTRTFTSFNLAELKLGADVVNLAPASSSLATKGESVEDTAITLCAMGVRVLVVRHTEAGFPERLAAAFDGHVVNAGDGAHAHPTQALLDLLTLREEFGSLDGRTIAIVGDVAHSRVAHSAVRGLRRLGANVLLVGPEELLPDSGVGDGVRIERDLDAVLPQADAIVLLRIQRERLHGLPLRDDEYVRAYRLDAARLQRLRPGAIIMHPGPYNRGVELDESVLRHPGWRYAKQVMHGVPVRMAVLDFLVNGA